MGFLLGPKNTWLILLLGMSLFATSAAVAKPQASLRRGELAPELEWLGADGANYRWQDLQQGHPAVVVFWGTWCAVCKKDWPELKVLAEEFATTEMAPVWIAVAVLDTPAKTAAVANQRQLPGVQLCDPEEKTSLVSGWSSCRPSAFWTPPGKSFLWVKPSRRNFAGFSPRFIDESRCNPSGQGVTACAALPL